MNFLDSQAPESTIYYDLIGEAKKIKFIVLMNWFIESTLSLAAPILLVTAETSFFGSCSSSSWKYDLLWTYWRSKKNKHPTNMLGWTTFWWSCVCDVDEVRWIFSNLKSLKVRFIMILLEKQKRGKNTLSRTSKGHTTFFGTLILCSDESLTGTFYLSTFCVNKIYSYRLMGRTPEA